MIKHLGTIIRSGLFDSINKLDYIDAFGELEITAQEFKAGDLIFRSGEVVDRVCIVEEGSVRTETGYTTGEVHILQIFEAGSLFAIEAAMSKRKTAPLDYVCNEDGVIAFIPLENIYNSTFFHEIYDMLLELLASDNIKKMHKIELLAERSLRHRILMYLDILYSKSDSDTVTVTMNREKMAQYLCVNRSSLSNELNNMKRDGIIDFDKETFRIL